MGKMTLGELDVAYSLKGDSGNAKAQITTTGKVAEILEARYGVMSAFYAARERKIAGFIADEVAHAIQDLVQGRPPGSVTYGAEQRIEAEFRSFLAAGEMEKISQAVFSPTTQEQVGTTGRVLSGAAARGVSQRRKKPNAKRKARPAFIDTGLYMQSFRVLIKLDKPTR